MTCQRRTNAILTTLVPLTLLALAVPAQAQSIGRLSANPYQQDSTSNPNSSVGSPYSPSSINNPHGTYGSPYSPNSVNNPHATDTPRRGSHVRTCLSSLAVSMRLPSARKRDAVSLPLCPASDMTSCPDTASNRRVW